MEGGTDTHCSPAVDALTKSPKGIAARQIPPACPSWRSTPSMTGRHTPRSRSSARNCTSALLLEVPHRRPTPSNLLFHWCHLHWCLVAAQWRAAPPFVDLTSCRSRVIAVRGSNRQRQGRLLPPGCLVGPLLPQAGSPAVHQPAGAPWWATQEAGVRPPAPPLPSTAAAAHTVCSGRKPSLRA